ncbi:MAG: drug/metabolite transporter (DMT)-like permease [Granulosicoccus sp.]
MILTTFLLVLLSALLHASWNLVTKKFAGNYSIIYLSFLGGTLLTLYPAMVHWPESNQVFIDNAWWLVVSCLVHGIYGFILSYTYFYGDISTLYPVVRGSGVALAVIISVFWVGEVFNGYLAAGCTAVIGGIALLSYKRNRKETSKMGILLAVTCGLLIATYTVIDKVLVDQIHPITVLFILQASSGLMFLPYVLKSRMPELRNTIKHHWKATAYVCGAATMSYSIILYVFQNADVSRVATVRETAVVFGAIGGYLIFKESFSLLRLIGVIAVAFGIILVKLS